MNAGIRIYLDGSVEETLPNMINHESGLKSGLRLDGQISNLLILQPRNEYLSKVFIYQSYDPLKLSSPLHIQAQESLGFKFGSYLSYEDEFNTFNLNEFQMGAFGEIIRSLVTKGIPCCMFLIDITREERLFRGYNPKKGLEILATHPISK